MGCQSTGNNRIALLTQFHIVCGAHVRVGMQQPAHLLCLGPNFECAFQDHTVAAISDKSDNKAFVEVPHHTTSRLAACAEECKSETHMAAIDTASPQNPSKIPKHIMLLLQ